MMKKQKSHLQEFIMGRKNRFTNTTLAGADETFYAVTMDNGKSSPALNAKQEVLDWLDEHFVNTVTDVSQITVKRKKRKSALLRDAERKSEIMQLEKRLEFLKEQPPVFKEGSEAM
jgi:hypothetical protein